MRAHMIISQVLLATLVAAVAVADYVPVLIYSPSSSMPSGVDGSGSGSGKTPLTVGQPLTFDDISASIKSSNVGVQIIVVKELSDEELRPLLRESSVTLSTLSVAYYPLVVDPFEQLRSELKSTPVTLTDADTVRQAFNTFLASVANGQAAVLTAHRAPAHLRRRRDVGADALAATPFNEFAFGDNCAAGFDDVLVLDATASTSAVPVSLALTEEATMTCATTSKTTTLSMTFNKTNAGIGGDAIVQLTMNFQLNNQYWVFANANVTTAKGVSYGLVYLDGTYGMETPLTFSYVCTRSHYRLYDQSSNVGAYIKADLYINKLQIQPFNITTNGTAYVFGKVNYCQGFFSSGIWMAITSSLLLTFILAVGVSFLFNVKTMDKFDDPKGKPLNIAIEK